MWPYTLLVILTLVLMASILWTTSIGAPWAPSSLKKVRKMLELAEVGPGDVVYDLGCGDGRTLVTAARRFNARAVGIEIDPLRYIWCQFLITILGLRGRVKIKFGNFFKQDLSEANVVTCYLLPSTNEKLESKLIEELASDARVVSNDFVFPGLRLAQKDNENNLYLYNPVP